MANGKSKFSGLADLRDHNNQPSERPKQAATGRAGDLDLPTRKLQGKRSNPDYRGRTVLLKIKSQEQTEQRLRQNHSGTDFSDLMQALLEQWLAKPA
jgi:hypothetical protein